MARNGRILPSRGCSCFYAVTLSFTSLLESHVPNMGGAAPNQVTNLMRVSGVLPDICPHPLIPNGSSELDITPPNVPSPPLTHLTRLSHVTSSVACHRWLPSFISSVACEIKCCVKLPGTRCLSSSLLCLHNTKPFVIFFLYLLCSPLPFIETIPSQCWSVKITPKCPLCIQESSTPYW